MLDCGKCGGEKMNLEDDVYVCAECGKRYTKGEAQQREQAYENLRKKRMLLLALMGGCLLLMIISALLLPGYADSGSHAGLILATTGLCVALFIAALVVRIRFGRDRRNLYPGE